MVTADLADRPMLAGAGADHLGHRTAALLGRGPGGLMVGAVVCNCGTVLRWLPRCPATTLAGRPCRAIVRTDLGYTSCASHSRMCGRLPPGSQRREGS